MRTGAVRGPEITDAARRLLAGGMSPGTVAGLAAGSADPAERARLHAIAAAMNGLGRPCLRVLPGGGIPAPGPARRPGLRLLAGSTGGAR